MEELPHRAMLALSPGGKPQRLMNRGTGEIVGLPEREGCIFQLCYCPEGFGVLAPSDESEGVWATDLFQLALVGGVADEGTTVAIYDKKFEYTTGIADAMATYTKGGYYHNDGASTFSSEIYVYRTKWPVCANVFWSMPHIQNAVVGVQQRPNWVSEHRPGIVSALGEFGFGEGHFQQSAKSLRAAARDGADNRSVIASAGQEFVISSSGLCILLLYWAKSGLRGNGQDVLSACMSLLRNVFDRFFRTIRGEAALPVHDFHGVVILTTIDDSAQVRIDANHLPVAGRSF